MYEISFQGGTLLMFDDLRFGISWLRLEIEAERERGRRMGTDDGGDGGERKSRRREAGD